MTSTKLYHSHFFFQTDVYICWNKLIVANYSVICWEQVQKKTSSRRKRQKWCCIRREVYNLSKWEYLQIKKILLCECLGWKKLCKGIRVYSIKEKVLDYHINSFFTTHEKQALDANPESIATELLSSLMLGLFS